MSNSVQLKHVLSKSTSHAFYGTQVTLGIVSILMCASIGKFSRRERRRACFSSVRFRLFACSELCRLHLVPKPCICVFPFPDSRLRSTILVSVYSARSITTGVIAADVHATRTNPSSAASCTSDTFVRSRRRFSDHHVQTLISARRACCPVLCVRFLSPSGRRPTSRRALPTNSCLF